MVEEIKEIINELIEKEYSVKEIERKLNNDSFCLTDFIIDNDDIFFEFLIEENDEIRYERYFFCWE